MNTPNRLIEAHPESVFGDALQLVIHPASEWKRIAPVWAELFQSSSSRSFFLSNTWTETWIETYAPHMNVSILLFESAERPVGVCLLVDAKKRRAMIPTRQLSLNASGEDARETTYIEYNDVLCRPGWERAVATMLAAYVVGREWDEFALDGFSAGPVYDTLKHVLGPFELEEVVRPCYYIDLRSLHCSGKRYETVLRSRYRNTLRRNIKAYAELGPVRLEPATDVGEALSMFDELTVLNQRRWATRGRHSPFAAQRFLAFHRNLIRRCACEHSIQMLRLAAGEHTVGILYNLIYAGKVHAYQCGYDYATAKHHSPGIITHAYAIQYCLDRGLDEWDFLSGDASFKRSLSTDSRNLVWAVFRKPSLKLRILSAARAARRKLQSFRRFDFRNRAKAGSFDE